MGIDLKKSIENANRKELEEAYAYLDRLARAGKINPVIQIDDVEKRKQHKIERLEKLNEEWQNNKDQISLACLIGVISLGAMILGIGSTVELNKIPSNVPSKFLSVSAISLSSIGATSEFLAIRELLIALSKKSKLERKRNKLINDIEDLKERSR